MLSYQGLTHHPRALRAFTGLDQSEFEKLLVPFAMAYHAYMYDQHVTKKARKRRYGGGRKSRLASMEDKLLFILFYQNMAEGHTFIGVGECHPYREFEGMQPSR